MIAAALLLAASVQAVALPSPEPVRADLVVTVEGVKGGGEVRLDVCAAKTFLTDRCAISSAVPAQDGSVTVTLHDVPAGEYAIQAWHDRDGDRQVSRNALGMPTEAFGFSRSPALGLHGPSFTKAAFAHGGAPQAVTVKLRRLF